MDAYYAPAASVRPWRAAALVAAAVAAVELVLLVVAGIVILAPTISHEVKGAAQTRAKEQARAAPAPAPKPSRPAPVVLHLTRGETSILVLNGNGVAGAAGRAADQVRRLGYAVGFVGNAARSDYSRTLVMYRPGYRAEGLRLARDLRVRSVGPLDGLRPRELRGSHLALVLGR